MWLYRSLNTRLENAINAEEAEAARTYKELTDNIRATAQRVNELEIESRSQPLTPEKNVELQNRKTELSSMKDNFLKFLKGLAERLSQTKTAGTLERSKSQTQAWQEKLTELGTGTVLLTTLLTENRYYVIITTPNTQIVRSKELSSEELTQQIEVLREVIGKPSSLVLGDPRAEKNYR